MLATRVASYFIAAVAVAAAAAAELCFNLTGREALPTFRLAGTGDGATDAAAALKFQQFDRRLRRMMIALIMSLGSGFVGGGFATHVECLVQRDRRRSAPGYKLDAAALPTAPTATATSTEWLRDCCNCFCFCFCCHFGFINAQKFSLCWSCH